MMRLRNTGLRTKNGSDPGSSSVFYPTLYGIKAIISIMKKNYEKDFLNSVLLHVSNISGEKRSKLVDRRLSNLY
jgi:hypothetical protein